MDEEFSRFGNVDKVTIVYDQRVSLLCRLVRFVSPPCQSDRSRGFGFIKMATTDDAARCIKELNGIVSL